MIHPGGRLTGFPFHQRVQILNTCSLEGRAQWRHEESQRSLWWRQQANCGWSRGWRSAASGQQEPPPSSWGLLHTDLVSLHQHGRVFVRHNRYVQVGPSSPLGAVIGRVNKSYKIQRQLRFGHRLQWLYAMLLDIQTTSLELPVMIENSHSFQMILYSYNSSKRSLLKGSQVKEAAVWARTVLWASGDVAIPIFSFENRGPLTWPPQPPIGVGTYLRIGFKYALNTQLREEADLSKILKCAPFNLWIVLKCSPTYIWEIDSNVLPHNTKWGEKSNNFSFFTEFVQKRPESKTQMVEVIKLVR